MSCGKGDDEDVQTSSEMPARRQAPKSAKCVRCKTKEIEFSRQAARYCKECFVVAFSKRFKDVTYLAREHCRAPKKAKDKSNATLLLAYSGSSSSRVTLDLLNTLYIPDSQTSSHIQAAFGRVEVLHVITKEDGQDLAQKAREQVAGYGLTLSTVTLEDAFAGAIQTVDVSDAGLSLEQCQPNTTSGTLLGYEKFTATASETVRNSILNSYIMDYAREQGHRAVLLCDSATKLAAKTLSSISKGQGFALGEIVAAAEVPVLGSDICLYRPLSGVSDEEVQFYAEKVKGWPHIPFVHSQSSGQGSIDALVQSFVQNLEAGFPSTVSVISRTASKLGLRSIEDATGCQTCALCSLPKDPDANAWRPVASLSRLPTENTLQDTVEAKADTLGAPSPESLARYLCYGCLVPFMELQGPSRGMPLTDSNEAGNLLRLPAYIQYSPAGKVNGASWKRPDLRSQIQDFLLEP